MISAWAIVCIIFVAILMRGYILAVNINKHHEYSCRSIIIPEDIDIPTAFTDIIGRDINFLKKRASSLGATREFINSSSLLELKVFILQNSISERHIIFEELEQSIVDKEIENYNLRNPDNPYIPQDGDTPREIIRDLQENYNLESVETYNLLSDNPFDPTTVDVLDPRLSIQELREDLDIDD